MDDDNLRRGQPSCHVQYSEWAAILAGDALHTLAFTLLTQAAQFDNKLELGRAVSILAAAAGMEGMVSGQALDLAAEKEPQRYIPIDKNAPKKEELVSAIPRPENRRALSRML